MTVLCFCGAVCLYSVFSDPGKKVFISHLSRGNAKACLNHIIVGAVQSNAVDLKESQHDIHADTLVAIHKGMVGDQRIAQPCALFLFGGVKLLTAKGLKTPFQRTVQQADVA